MIKAETIISQLQDVLPNYTGLFSKADISITSLTRSGTTVTAVTAVDHLLSVGDFAFIKDALSPLTISSLTRVLKADGVTSTVTAVTTSNHDFTEGFDQTAEIVDADQTQYNGTFDIVNVPNRKTFTYEITTTPATPATGTIFVLNNNATGYNRRHEVATVADSTTFTYEITQTPDSPAQGSPVLRSGLRVSGSVSIDRAFDSYTRQNQDNFWAFVVLDTVFTSKDRNVNTDASNTIAAGDDYRQRIIIPFSIYVIAPTSSTGTDTGALEVRDEMEDVAVALFKSLLGVKLDTVLANTQQYYATFLSHGFQTFANAFYVHQFQFETVVDITRCDIVDPDFNVAFRDVSLVFINPDEEDTDNTIMTANVDLDDDPL